MTRLSWDVFGERFYETGVDRGVLYLANQSGVAWQGLISVTESPTGGEPRPYYMDGRKYLNLATAEEFEATINAFSSPPEFAPCDGVSSIQNGLFATQQPRTAFGFSYRTRVGNDVDGVDHGYKIHLVYNALASPSERSHNTLGDEADPTIFSWPITTLPPSLTGRKPTAHLVIDSRKTPRGLLAYVEDILYGSDAAAPRLPMPQELADLFQSEGPVVARNLVLNPSVEGSDGTVVVRQNLATNPWARSRSGDIVVRTNLMHNPEAVQSGGYYNSPTWLTGLGAPWPLPTAAKKTPTGAWNTTDFGTMPATGASPVDYSVRFFAATDVGAANTAWLLQNISANLNIFASWQGTLYKDDAPAQVNHISANQSGAWYECRFTVPANQPAYIIGLKDVSGGAGAPITVTAVTIEAAPESSMSFSGNSAASDDFTYAWTGTPHGSTSEQRAPSVVRWATYSDSLYASVYGLPGGSGATLLRKAHFTGSLTGIANGVNLPIASGAATIVFRLRARGGPVVADIGARTANDGTYVAYDTSPYINLDDGEELVSRHVIEMNSIGTFGGVGNQVQPAWRMVEDPGPNVTLDALEVAVIDGYYDGDPFNGSDPATGDFTYNWISAVDGSVSEQRAPKLEGQGFLGFGVPYLTKDAISGEYSLALVNNTSLVSNLAINTEFNSRGRIDISTGSVVTILTKVRNEDVDETTVRIDVGDYLRNRTYLGYSTGAAITVPPGEEVEYRFVYTPRAGTEALRLVPYALSISPGKRVVWDDFMVAEGVYEGPYVDGSMPDQDGYFYSWEGDPHTSPSILRTWN